MGPLTLDANAIPLFFLSAIQGELTALMSWMLTFYPSVIEILFAVFKTPFQTFNFDTSSQNGSIKPRYGLNTLAVTLWIDFQIRVVYMQF
jgi:hypothetical protein